MSQISISGTEIRARSAEESVLYDNWITWLKNLAIACIRKAHLPIEIGWKYNAVTYWMGLILFAMLDQTLEAITDELDDALWTQTRHHQRIKIYPQKYRGLYPRYERKYPNADQLRKYRNTLPEYLLKTLNHFIFECQLEYAESHRLISKTIDLLVDNTAEWYYGKDRYPDNPFITGGYNGPGTNHKRNYLGIMLKSGTTYLYCGVTMIKKEASNVPFILETLDWLILKGYRIRYVLGDRWFPTFELIQALTIRGVSYIGPYKKLAAIKRIILHFLETGKDYIIPYTIKGAPAKYYKETSIPIWLILTNPRGRRLNEIRQDYLMKTKSLKECMKEIMVMMTTEHPPKGRKARQGWAMQIFHRYTSRWHIETGFRDLNRITPTSNARTNGRKFFMNTVRYWIFNCWQLERAKRKKLRRSPKSWRRGPTLRRFRYVMKKVETCL